MKILISGLLLLFALTLINVDYAHAKNIDGKLLGVWRLTEIIDPKTKDVSVQRAVVMYHFHGDGTLITNNTHVREKITFVWRANRGYLKLKSKNTKHYFEGTYRYVDDDTFRFYVRIGKQKFIWVFERY